MLKGGKDESVSEISFEITRKYTLNFTRKCSIDAMIKTMVI